MILGYPYFWKHPYVYSLLYPSLPNTSEELLGKFWGSKHLTMGCLEAGVDLMQGPTILWQGRKYQPIHLVTAMGTHGGTFIFRGDSINWGFKTFIFPWVLGVQGCFYLLFTLVFEGFCTTISQAPSSWWLKCHFAEVQKSKENRFETIIQSLRIQSPSQIMIWVYNHLRNERYLGSITILKRWLDP